MGPQHLFHPRRAGGKNMSLLICSHCNGNGVVPIKGGISPCSHCKGRCYISAPAGSTCPHCDELRAEVERLREALYRAHVDLGADGGITEHDCECDDCIAYLEEVVRRFEARVAPEEKPFCYCNDCIAARAALEEKT